MIIMLFVVIVFVMIVVVIVMVVVVIVMVVVVIMMVVVILIMVMPVTMSMSVGMAAHSSEGNGQDPGIRSLQDGLPPLHEEVTFVEKAGVHEVLIHELERVNVLGRGEAEGVQELTTTDRKDVIHVVVEKCLLELRLPHVVFNLKSV